MARPISSTERAQVCIEVVVPTLTSSLRAMLRSKWLLIASGIVVLLAMVAAFGLAPKWPFRAAEFKKRVERDLGARVEVQHFQQTFFPHPGCIADGVTLTYPDPAHPKITIQKVTVDGLYSGLIGKDSHLRMLSLEGMRIEFPAGALQKPDTKPLNVDMPSGIKFDQIEARNSQLIFAPNAKEKQARRFEIYDVILKSFAPGKPIHFNAVLRIPEPAGDVKVDGSFGPLTGKTIGDAQLNGRFSLRNADLSKFHALMGTLSAQGKFEGPLRALKVTGTTDSPNFGATHTQHSLPLRTEFSTVVDGTNGNLELQPVRAVLGKSNVVATGKLEDAPDGAGKLLTVDISSDAAQIQDLMYLFIHSRPPLQGATRFQMKVQLPSNKKPFEERVRLTGRFGISSSKFTKPETEQKVSQLSEQAKGHPNDDDPPMVVTNLRGEVTLADGTAHFSRLDVSVPGAGAALHGQFHLENHTVDLHGTLHTDVKLSDATTGFKAFLMKVVELAKKKDKHGATVPVKITGTYEKPEFGVDATAER